MSDLIRNFEWKRTTDLPGTSLHLPFYSVSIFIIQVLLVFSGGKYELFFSKRKIIRRRKRIWIVQIRAKYVFEGSFTAKHLTMIGLFVVHLSTRKNIFSEFVAISELLMRVILQIKFSKHFRDILSQDFAANMRNKYSKNRYRLLFANYNMYIPLSWYVSRWLFFSGRGCSSPINGLSFQETATCI